ncbi:unnamed protein product [Caenorhabditis brenneri]
MSQRGGGAGASNDVGEQQQEEEAEPDKTRFLRQRKRQNTDSNYHPTHDKKAVAKIPPIQRGESSTQRERDQELMVMPLDDIHPGDIAFMRQNAPHLPDDVILEVLASFDYNAEEAIEVAKQMAKPEMMASPIKNMIVANIAMEKDANPTKKLTWKEFYMENMMKGAVDTRTLVDFYYKEKNKLGGNWRMEYDDPPETAESKEELERRMNNAGITIVARDAAAVRHRIRAQNPSVPTRQLTRARRSEVERLMDNSDTDSGSNTPSNQPSSSASTQPSTSGEQPPKINMRFRFRPSQAGQPPSNISIIHTARNDNQPSTSSASTSRSTQRPAPPSPESEADAETPRRRHSTRISSGASQDQQQQQPSPQQNQSPQRRGALHPNRKRKSS